MKGVLVATATACVLAAAAACSSSAPSPSVNTPTRTVTATVTHQATPGPTRTRTVAPPSSPSSRPAVPAPPATVTTAPPAPRTTSAPTTSGPTSPTPPLTNAAAVVQQYYQDLTDHDYAAAWALGGRNIAGESYAQYVAGFADTASISLGTVSEFGASEVQAVLYATQTDGTLQVYEGTYTVSNGQLVGASIRRIQ